METGEIIFWSLIAIFATVFIVIFSMVLKDFINLLKRAKKYSEEFRKNKKVNNR